MSEGKRAGSVRTILILPLVALVAAALFLTWEQNSPRDAEAGGPGMTINAPANVVVNQTFAVQIVGSPLPAAYSGYSTEILLPAGLKYQAQECLDEIGVSRDPPPPGGPTLPVASCIFALGPGAELRHVIIGEIAVPPHDPFVGGPLIDVNVRCNTVGTYKIVLTAVPGSSFGAAYFAPDTSPILVTTISQDIDGDKTPENIADGHVVNCTPPPTQPPPTNTVPPTSTATPCPPGEVPAPGGGCAIPTATPTAAPATPTPTPLQGDTHVTLSGPSDAPPGSAVDVTANVLDAEGNPLPGVNCVFTIVDAPEGSDASLAADSAVSGADGNAIVTLTVGTVPGTVNVQADCGGIASQVLAVNVTEGVTGPPTGDSDSAASIAIWVMLASALAAGLAGLGYAGWRKVSHAR